LKQLAVAGGGTTAKGGTATGNGAMGVVGTDADGDAAKGTEIEDTSTTAEGAPDR